MLLTQILIRTAVVSYLCFLMTVSIVEGNVRLKKSEKKVFPR